MKLRISKLLALLLAMAMLGIAHPVFAGETQGSLPDAAPDDSTTEETMEKEEEGDVKQVIPMQIPEGVELENTEESGDLQEDVEAEEEEFSAEAAAQATETGMEATEPMGDSAHPGDAEPDIVTTEAELKEWIANNSSGTVKLGKTITITRTDSGRFYYPVMIENPIVIDTGEHGLVYNNGYILMANPEARIIGEGARVPVVDVQDMGWFMAGSWMDALYSSNITATGTAEQGGTAMRIHKTDKDQNFYYVGMSYKTGLIRAFGKNAIGLELMSSFAISGWDIAVEGEGSTAILAHQGTSVCFSKLSATGDGARTVGGSGDIAVDTCIANPAPAGDTVALYTSKFFPTWYPVRRGEPISAKIDVAPVISGCSAATLKQPFGIAWDQEALQSIDTSIPGLHTVTGELDYDWYKTFLPDSPQLIIAVRDRDDPCVFEVRGDIGNEVGGGAFLCMWRAETWTFDKCIVWRSDDGGKTWADCTGEEGVGWEENEGQAALNGLFIPYTLIGDGTMFVIETPDGRESNLIRFSHSEGQTVRKPSGGDRVGTDRVTVVLGEEKPVWPDPEDDEEEPNSPSPGEVDDTPKDDPGKTGTVPPGNTDISNTPAEPGDDLLQAPGGTENETVGNTVSTVYSNASGMERPLDAGAHNTIRVAPDLATLVIAAQTESDSSLPEISLPKTEEAPIAAAGGFAEDSMKEEPAAQPKLSEPGTGGALTVSACIAAATMAGWLLLRKIKAVKR